MAGRYNASHDAQDAWDAGDASLASGRNADGSDAGSFFADESAPTLLFSTISKPFSAPYVSFPLSQISDSQFMLINEKQQLPHFSLLIQYAP